MDESTKFIAFSALGLVDDLTTAIACSFYGPSIERTNWRRKLMERFGVWKSAGIQLTLSQLAYYTPIATAYFIERQIDPTMKLGVYNWVMLTYALPIGYTIINNMLNLSSKKLETLLD